MRIHEQTIIFRQLFAGHVVGFRSMKRKRKMHLMINMFIYNIIFQSSLIHYFQVLLKMLKPSWQLTQWKYFLKVKHQCIHMRHHQFSPDNINMINARAYHARTNSLIFKQVLSTILIL